MQLLGDLHDPSESGLNDPRNWSKTRTLPGGCTSNRLGSEKMPINIERQGDRLLLKFPYNAQLKDDLKAKIGYPRIRWEPDDKAWSIADDDETKDIAQSIFIDHKMGFIWPTETHVISSGQNASNSTDGLVANWYQIDEMADSYYQYYLNVGTRDGHWAERRIIINDLQRQYPDNF